MTLILDSITVQGFGSYTQMVTLTLGGQGAVAIVGANGAGKSTIASKALAWCLYGKTAPERMGSGTGMMRGKSILHPKAKKAIVMVALRRGDEMITITRERKRKGADKLTIDADPAEQGDVDAIIGVDYDVFVRTCLRGQADPWNWAEATDGRKREVLDAISGADRLAEPYERAKRILRDLLAIEDSYRQREAAAERRVQESDPAGAERNLAQWEADQATRLASARSELQRLREVLAQKQKADAAAAGLQAQRQTVHAPAFNLKPQEDWESEQRHKYTVADGQLAVLRTQLAAIPHHTPGANCPTCGQAVGPDAPVEKIRSDLTQKVAAATAVREQAHAEYSDAHRRLEEARAYVRQEQAKYEAELKRTQVPAPQAPAAQEAVEKAERWVQEIERAENPWARAVEQARAHHETAKRDLGHLSEARRQAHEDLVLAQGWVDVLHPKGVRSHMSRTALAAIETAANSWLSVLTGGAMQISLLPTKDVKGGSREEIQVIVTMNGEERDLISLSGGEKRRVNLAVDMGIAAVFAKGGALALSLLVLDEEVFSGMDEQGKQAVAQAIHQAGVADVVVIDHDPRLSGVLPRTIEVTRGPEGSQIEEL